MIALSADVDVSQIEKAFNDYTKYNTRAIPDLVNATDMFVARGAVAATYAADKVTIRASRMKPSNVNPKAPLQAILVNLNRKKKGLPGLNGNKMSIAVEKAINKAAAYSQYTRSQWLTPAKVLSPYVKGKSGAPKIPSGVRVKGTHNGGALVATPNSGWQAHGEVWISVEAKDNAERVKAIVDKGLQQAVDNETRSKLEYNLQKSMEEGIKIFG